MVAHIGGVAVPLDVEVPLEACEVGMSSSHVLGKGGGGRQRYSLGLPQTCSPNSLQPRGLKSIIVLPWLADARSGC